MLEKIPILLKKKKTVEKRKNETVENLKYPESPEAKDNDDKVNGVCQEHEDIDISHCAVLRMDEVIEELTNREVDLSCSDKNTKWIEMPLISADTKT